MLYIKTVHFWLKYNGLAIVRKTTKLIAGGHRGLQNIRGLGGTTGSALDSRSEGRGFDSH